MNIGNRIIFDQDGDIIFQTGEMQGDVSPRKEITSLDFVDLNFGDVNLITHRIIGVDVATKKVITESLPPTETDQQRQIRELEDALLLQTDSDVGGIL